MSDKLYSDQLLDRLGKYFALLASPHDAEVVTAARKIQTSLQAEGADLNDLAAAIARGGFGMTNEEVQSVLVFMFEDLFNTIKRGHWALTQAERMFVKTMDAKRNEGNRSGMSVEELIRLRNLGIEVSQRIGKRH